MEILGGTIVHNLYQRIIEWVIGEPYSRGFVDEPQIQQEVLESEQDDISWRLIESRPISSALPDRKRYLCSRKRDLKGVACGWHMVPTMWSVYQCPIWMCWIRADSCCRLRVDWSSYGVGEWWMNDDLRQYTSGTLFEETIVRIARSTNKVLH